MFKVKRSFFVPINVTPNYLNYIAQPPPPHNLSTPPQRLPTPPTAPPPTAPTPPPPSYPPPHL